MNVTNMTMSERSARIILWVMTFLAPAVSMNEPMPYAAYALVPALAAADGVTPRGALFWAAMMLGYEALYRIPVGTLAVPVIILAALHLIFKRFIRLERNARTDRHAAPSVSLVPVALFWIVGMAVLSVLRQSVFSGHDISWSAVLAVWTRGIPFVAVACAMVIVLLKILRRRASQERPFRYT